MSYTPWGIETEQTRARLARVREQRAERLRQYIDEGRNAVPVDRDILLEFVASLDNHRGVDIRACFTTWVKDTYGIVPNEVTGEW